MRLNEMEAIEKFDQALKQIRTKDTAIIDLSGIHLSPEQLISIALTLSKAPLETLEEQEPMFVEEEEYKSAPLLNRYNENIEYILMNDCGLTEKHITAITSILAVTKLKGLGLDNNDLSNSVLFRMVASMPRNLDEPNPPPIKIWARESGVDDEVSELAHNDPTLEFKCKGDTVARKIDNVYAMKHRSADFSDETLSLDNLDELALAVQYHSHLRELGFANVKLNVDAIAILARIVKSLPNLHTLTLSGCSLDDKGIEILYSALLTCKNLKILFLHDNNITAFGAGLIARLLPLNIIQFLTISNNKIEDSGVKYLSWALAANRSLLNLELRSCMITAEGAAIIIAALQHNKSLQSLNLAGNPIGDEGIKNLALGNLRLQYLYLNKCGIGDLGAKYLAATFLADKAPALHMLDVSQNAITDAGINGEDGLAAGLNLQTNLEFCNFADNPLGDASMPAIARLIEEHFKLNVLDLSACNLTAAGIAKLASALESNSCITEIILSKNRITDSAAILLAKMLEVNYTLIKMYLRNTGITNSGAQALLAAITNNMNSQIESIDIRKNSVYQSSYVDELLKISKNVDEDDIDSDSEQDMDDGCSEHDSVIITVTDAPFIASPRGMLTHASASLSLREPIPVVNEKEKEVDPGADNEEGSSLKKLKL